VGRREERLMSFSTAVNEGFFKGLLGGDQSNFATPIRGPGRLTFAEMDERRAFEEGTLKFGPQNSVQEQFAEFKETEAARVRERSALLRDLNKRLEEEGPTRSLLRDIDLLENPPRTLQELLDKQNKILDDAINTTVSGKPGIKRLKYPGLENFYTRDRDIIEGVKNKTGLVTELLKSLSTGASPRSLGLIPQEDVELASRRFKVKSDILFHGGGALDNPLERLQQGLLGQQAAQGFGLDSGSVLSFQKTNPANQLRALQEGVFGDTPSAFNPNEALGQSRFLAPFIKGGGTITAEHARTKGRDDAFLGISSVFNPPPFFDLLGSTANQFAPQAQPAPQGPTEPNRRVGGPGIG
jgi:hypothetical protein